jgi:hypothetical protein
MEMSDNKKFDQREIKLEWITVCNLAVVWENAQRDYNASWAKEIAEAFDPEKFDPVRVMLPNGNGIYHICEGQHRVGGVRMLWGDQQQVPCIVAQTSDPARAAEIFLGNSADRHNINKIAKFKVSVTAQRKEEVAIDRIVRHCGYRVEGSHVQDTIAAVDALKFVYRKGAKTLDRTLHTLRQTWGGDPTAVSGSVLRAYGSFICEFSENLDWTRLIENVRKRTTPGRLMNDIRVNKAASHVTSVEAGVVLLLRLYNSGLRDKLKRKGKE